MSEELGQLRMLVALMAHRIRSPLSVIAGRAGVLLADAPADRHRDLQSIEREAQRISRALESVLVIAHIGDGEGREWVPLDEIAGGAVARLGNDQSGLALGYGIPEGLLVHIDAVLGELLVLALLENVLRHAPGSSAEVLGRRVGPATAIEIVDRGPGLPLGAARTLREPLRAGERRGFGFAMCQSIVQRYGGTIDAEARAGGGTSITVTIPDGEMLPAFEQEATV